MAKKEIFAATRSAKKKLEGGHNPFKGKKAKGCTSPGCAVKNGASNQSAKPDGGAR